MTVFGVRPQFSGPPTPDPDLDARIADIVERALADPFVGVHASGASGDGLFSIGKTGISTDELVSSARRFLDRLTSFGRDRAILDLDSDEWRTWCNFHLANFRHGVPLGGITDGERERALDLVAAAMSADGYATARDIMRLNDTLAEVTGRPEEFGEWLYWLSIFGEPTADRPWGFQFDGHHLNVNCLVLGDQLVLSPLFLGSEPVHAESGRHAGTQVFQHEESDGFALMAAMSPEEQRAAIVGTELPRELLTAAFHDNVELGFEGISHDQLSPAARERLLALIARYVGHIRPGHAEIKMTEVREHLDETFFCWIGGTGVDDVFYYRVQSPVILIEFDHLAGIVFDNDFPTRRHIHTVVRTPNGNDYGKNLLAQHYATHHAG
jgi:hypothetical protein